jgi:hypothetical protein
MVVSQFIKVRNPPTGRRFVAYATMPLARPAPVTRIGNSFNALQQYHFLGRLQNWDIYEWMVLCSPGTTLVGVGDSFSPPVGGFHALPASGGSGSKRKIILQSPLKDAWSPISELIEQPAAFSLRFEGHGGLVETVPISGVGMARIRSGFLRHTTYGHVRTANFGSFHWWWDVTAFDPYVRLCINWHTGIPAPEVLFRHVRLNWPGSAVNWISELNDPAMIEGQGYLVAPNDPNGHLMPRMAQRSFRIVVYEAGQPVPSPQACQDAGWGVADWSQGGYLPAALRLHPLTHITDLDSRVLSASSIAVDELARLENDFDTSDDDTVSDAGAPPSPMWPAIGTMNAGPTGSDNVYKPYNGIKTLASNLREGLLYHKVWQLRMHSRDWNAIYEPDGQVVIPELHLDLGSNGNWSFYLTPQYPNGWSTDASDPAGPYMRWKDAGFEFDAHRERRFPPSGVRPYELQSGVIPGVGGIQRWDAWDHSHSMLGFQDDIALAWLCGDPLAIQYLTQKAEIARLAYWVGLGTAAGRIELPATAGVGVGWGRDVHWSMFAIANAAVFQTDDVPDLTDDDVSTPVSGSSRRNLWRDMELKRYIQGAHKALMSNGVCFFGLGKNFPHPPWNSNYYLNQIFEVNYGMSAIAACLGVYGNAWDKWDAAGVKIRVIDLIRPYGRALDTLIWGTTTPVATVAIDATNPGSGYTAGDIVYLIDDWYYANSLPRAIEEANVQITTVGAGGVPTAVALNVAGRYHTQPYSPTRTYCKVDAPVVAAGGSGYAVGNLVRLAGGIPINHDQDWEMVCKVNAIGGGGAITALVLTGGTGAHEGKYLSPPPGGAQPLITETGFGSGATCTFARSCTGSPIKVTGGTLVTGPPERVVNGTIGAGGSGYVAADVGATLTVVGGTFTTAATFRITAVTGGAVAGVVLVNGGTGYVFPVPANPAATAGGTGTGCTLNLQYLGMTGYVVGDVGATLTIIGGLFTTAATFTIAAVANGAVSGISLIQGGSYTDNPGNPAATFGGSGNGCAINLTLGSGLRVTTTWGAVTEYGRQPWKIFPVRAYPAGAVFANRGALVPLDIINRHATKTPYTGDVGQQALEGISLVNVFGILGYVFSPEAAALFMQYTGTATVRDAALVIRGYGWGHSNASGGANLENFWPALSFFDMPYVP